MQAEINKVRKLRSDYRLLKRVVTHTGSTISQDLTRLTALEETKQQYYQAINELSTKAMKTMRRLEYLTWKNSILKLLWTDPE